MSDTDMKGWPAEDAAAAPASEPGAFADVPTDEDGMPTEDAMRQALKAVMDPEIGINVVDLGLIYGFVKEDGKVTVDMTLTSMGCPLTELIHSQCTLVLAPLPGVEEVDVNFTFSPPWSTEMIADEAKDELRAMGFSV
ncbi:MAG: metal-sulfur cluster assembly factor [Egibacteraceae bacterium]